MQLGVQSMVENETETAGGKDTFSLQARSTNSPSPPPTLTLLQEKHSDVDKGLRFLFVERSTFHSLKDFFVVRHAHNSS